EHKGRRKAAFVLVKMMLRDPGTIKAAALGMDDLRDRQSVAFGRIRLVGQAGEEAEAYRRLRCRHPLNLVPCLPAAIKHIEIAERRDFSLLPSIAPSYDSAFNRSGENGMFSHIMVGSNDTARAKKFYDAIFTAIGASPATEDA